MPKWDEQYRGYYISYQRGDRFAWIYRPGDWGILNEVPERTSLVGARDELREKAQVIIDNDILASEAPGL